jgi:hypothetical protein
MWHIVTLPAYQVIHNGISQVKIIKWQVTLLSFNLVNKLLSVWHETAYLKFPVQYRTAQSHTGLRRMVTCTAKEKQTVFLYLFQTVYYHFIFNLLPFFQMCVRVSKSDSHPFTGLERPQGLQEVETLRIFWQSAHGRWQGCQSYALATFTFTSGNLHTPPTTTFLIWST